MHTEPRLRIAIPAVGGIFAGPDAGAADRPELFPALRTKTAGRARRVLLVEDNPGDAELARLALAESPERFEVAWVETLAAALAALPGGAFAAMLLDLDLPDSRGSDTLERVLAAAPDLAIVVLTGLADEQAAVEGVRRGAQEFLAKRDVAPRLLSRALLHAIERKRLLDALERGRRLEAVGRLAGGVAHDFNNLLQVGLSLVEQARRSPPGAAASTLDDFESVFRRGAELARKLLLFARKEPPLRSRNDLGDVVRGVADMLRRLLHDNIEFRTAPAGEPLPLLCDRSQVEQVVANLILNAAEAMPDGGALEIRIGREGDRVWFAVEDTGVGIPPEVVERLFEPFFTTKTAAGNSGLGLALVHGIVAEHGGSMAVESEVGHGTRIRVSFPALAGGEALAAASAAAGTEAEPAAGERILLVEDQEHVRLLLTKLLEQTGYAVSEAASAEAALSLDGPFDGLISDVSLPGIDGPRLAAILRRRWPGIAVVLMSGYAPEQVLEGAAADGETRFLQKPFALAQLTAALRDALRDHRS